MSAQRVGFLGIHLFRILKIVNEALRVRFCRDEAVQFSGSLLTCHHYRSLGGVLTSFHFQDNRYHPHFRVSLVG